MSLNRDKPARLEEHMGDKDRYTERGIEESLVTDFTETHRKSHQRSIPGLVMLLIKELTHWETVDRTIE